MKNKFVPKYTPQVELLTKEAIQEYFSISRRTFYRMIKSPLFPEPILIENKVAYWDKEDLDNFLDACRIN